MCSAVILQSGKLPPELQHSYFLNDGGERFERDCLCYYVTWCMTGECLQVQHALLGSHVVTMLKR